MVEMDGGNPRQAVAHDLLELLAVDVQALMDPNLMEVGIQIVVHFEDVANDFGDRCRDRWEHQVAGTRTYGEWRLYRLVGLGRRPLLVGRRGRGSRMSSTSWMSTARYPGTDGQAFCFLASTPTDASRG